MKRDGRARPESWITLGAGVVLLATVVFLVTTRETVSEALVVSMLTFSLVLMGVPLPDILRPSRDDDDEEDH
jgi:predicted membrane protein